MRVSLIRVGIWQCGVQYGVQHGGRYGGRSGRLSQPVAWRARLSGRSTTGDNLEATANPNGLPGMW